MDSNNSGSLQSSSGGDEEYDSRATNEMISPFLHAFGSTVTNHPQPPPVPPPPLSQYQTHPPAMFDPNLGPFTHPPGNADRNALYNLDSVWSRGLGSEPNYLGNLTGLSSSSSLSSAQSLLGVHGPGPGPSPSVDGEGGRAPVRSDQVPPVRSSRKRSRASRRAPTTVLTTDTSNFRQMVQEFTGIPAPPFSAAAAASPYSRRLDLFGPGCALRSGHLDPLGGSLYPFRPSAQKVNTSSFLSSASSQSLINSTIVETLAPPTNNTITGPPTTSNSFQLPSDLLNIQNPIQTFQSLLQSPLKYPSSTSMPSLGHGSKPQESSGSRVPSLDELGLTQERVDQSLAGFQGQGNSGGSFGGTNGGGGDSQNGGGYKLNCSASTSDFRPDKGLDNVSSRNDSWVCPSD